MVVARKLTTSREMLLWMIPSEAPKALQASECSELLDPMRASCWISAQHQPGKFTHVVKYRHNLKIQTSSCLLHCLVNALNVKSPAEEKTPLRLLDAVRYAWRGHSQCGVCYIDSNACLLAVDAASCIGSSTTSWQWRQQNRKRVCHENKGVVVYARRTLDGGNKITHNF